MNSELSYANQHDPASQSSEPMVPPKSFINRLMGVYFSPGETFQEIGRAPKLVLPIIALALLTMVTTVVILQRIPMEKASEERLEQMVAENKITEQQAEQQREFMRKFGSVFKYVIPVAAAIFLVVMALAFAGVAKLISSMMGIENRYPPLLAVTVYTMLAVSLVGSLVAILLIYLQPVDEINMDNPVATNLSAILSLIGVKGLPKFVSTFLSYVDVFFIWKVALLGIGYAAVSRKLKTSTAVGYVSAVSIVLALIHSTWSAIFG
ncbi:MAG: DUF2232 domain-containing protein [Acidobacteria bacterium]|nr:DUF2232 domain-containing protein [Acidobacteriota bacterium]